MCDIYFFQDSGNLVDGRCWAESNTPSDGDVYSSDAVTPIRM